MENPPQKILRYRKWIGVTLIFLAITGYWLLPIHGKVVLVPEMTEENISWPVIRLEPPHPIAGQSGKIIVTDNIPWVGVQIVVGGRNAKLEQVEEDNQAKVWNWTWSYIVPDVPSYEIIFYRDCNTGCLERARLAIGRSVISSSLIDPAKSQIPTKLGLVFANPDRDWHNRSGWVIDLTYARLPDAEYWGVNELAERVQIAADKGLHVLVRVDYDQGQGIPPINDYAALELYLKYLRQLARDQRLKNVYGFIIGSGFNARSSNQLSPEHLVTPEWYARVFNGYGVDPLQSDNVVETIRSENRTVRVLVGPVRPWITDQNGSQLNTLDAPWLNYLNTLVAAVDASATANDALGISRTAPDGFALQAPGRPDAMEFGGRLQAEEPLRDLPRPEWNGAQAGFRVYRDWLDIINAYPHTRYLPAYITSTNTFTPGQNIPPAENYPRGWLSTAFDVVNSEPQIQALCWFMDYIPNDSQWEKFRLTKPQGLLVDAANELDGLLQAQP